MYKHTFAPLTKASCPVPSRVYALYAFILLACCAFSGPAMAADAVGSVENATGLCNIVRSDTPLAAAAGAPVMLNDKVATGRDASLRIVFRDETVLTLGESSQASISNYVYSDKASDVLFSFTKGTFRTITGEIVKRNPEGFNMKTPLATIGIRGSDVYATVRPDGEEVGALHLGATHVLEIKTAVQTVRISKSGLRVTISPSGVISPPTPIPPDVSGSMEGLGAGKGNDSAIPIHTGTPPTVTTPVVKPPTPAKPLAPAPRPHYTTG